MSWDYYLGHSGETTLIKEKDLRSKLEDLFAISEVQNDDDGWVRAFTATEKGKTEDWEFTRQDEGYFWAGCTMNGNWIEELGRVCQKLAARLDWQINDPQSGDQWV